MNLSPSHAPVGGTPVLLDVWRAAALNGGWRFPADWFAPQVADVARAFEEGSDSRALAETSAALGAERARRGVGLRESMDDLALPFNLHGGGPPPFEVLSCFAQEWSEVATSSIQESGVTDTLTGLASFDYLRARVAEVYAEPHRRAASARHCLVVIEPRMRELPGWQRLARASSVAGVVKSVFDGGQTSASLPSENLVVLVRRDGRLAESMVRLRRSLAQARLDGVARYRVEPLPDTAHLAHGLLADL